MCVCVCMCATVSVRLFDRKMFDPTHLPPYHHPAGLAFYIYTKEKTRAKRKRDLELKQSGQFPGKDGACEWEERLERSGRSGLCHVAIDPHSHHVAPSPMRSPFPSPL